MKTIFDRDTFDGLLARLDAIQPDSPRQWGTMTAAQMLEHSARALEVAAGVRSSQQVLMGRLLGWLFKRSYVGPKPLARSGPTGADLVVRDDPPFPRTKARARALLVDLHRLGEAACDGRVHGFFGALSGREWGIVQYKHLDHHLRQFGVE